MFDSNYKPNERQQKCRHAFCYMGKNHGETYCRNEHVNPKTCHEDWVVSNEQCDTCPYYKSKYMEFPITVDKINYIPLDAESVFDRRAGSLVAIRPCAKEYEGKTFLGLHLGSLTHHTFATYNENNRELTVHPMNNPAIYVFELQKIIYGCESWWQTIDSINDFKEITMDDINSQWYVQLAKAIPQPKWEQNHPIRKPDPDRKNRWIYETGHEEPEIMGSGSTYTNVLNTDDETEAMTHFHNPANNATYLIRYKTENGRPYSQRTMSEWWDNDSKSWIPN